MSDVRDNTGASSFAQIQAERRRLAQIEEREAIQATPSAFGSADAAERWAEATPDQPVSTHNETLISRDTFLNEGRIGTRDERAALMDAFDQDGNEGFSEAEFEAAYSALMDFSEPGLLSSGVSREIQNALKDDKDTLQDLIDASSHVQNSADIQAILAVAGRKNFSAEETHSLLQALTRALDENSAALAPEMCAMYAAVAAGFDRLGRTAIGHVLRGAVEASSAVRKRLVHAIQDDKDTSHDLERAAKNARTPADLTLVMTLQRALGTGVPKKILQEALKGVDEDDPDLEMMRAIAGGFQESGLADYADLVLAAAAPGVNRETRKHLIHALQDDKNTARDIRRAFEDTETPRDVTTTSDVGRARVGEQHTELLAVTGLQERYENALKTAGELEPTLQLGLAALEGATEEQREDFIAAFREQHQDVYGEVEAAKRALTDALAASQSDLTAFITGDKVLPEVDPVVLTSALALIADTPQGLALANRVADALAQQLDDLGVQLSGTPGRGRRNPVQGAREELNQRADIYKAMMEQVLPVMVAAGGVDLNANSNAPTTAVERFLTALDGVEIPSGATEKWAQDIRRYSKDAQRYAGQFKNLKQGLERLDEAAAHRVIDEMAEFGTKLSTAFAALGLAAGAVAFANSEASWHEKVQASVSLAKDGSGLVKDLVSLNETYKGAAGKLNAVSGTLGVALDAWGAIQGFIKGDVAAGVVGATGTALSVLALTTSIPGLNVATMALSVGFALYQNAQQRAEENRRRDDVVQALVASGHFEPGYAELLAYNEPGTAKQVQNTLGVTPAQLSTFLEQHPEWIHLIDDVASPAFVRGLARDLRQPGENVLDLLGRISAGLPTSTGDPLYVQERALEYVVAGLVSISQPATGPDGTQKTYEQKWADYSQTYAMADSNENQGLFYLQQLLQAI